jgi:hypothetical protein
MEDLERRPIGGRILRSCWGQNLGLMGSNWWHLNPLQEQTRIRVFSFPASVPSIPNRIICMSAKTLQGISSCLPTSLIRQMKNTKCASNAVGFSRPKSHGPRAASDNPFVPPIESEPADAGRYDSNSNISARAFSESSINMPPQHLNEE